MHTRAQTHLLVSLRSILRHLRRECMVTPPPAQGAGFASYVLRRFREGAAVKDRAQVKLLRAQAADLACYLDAAAEHKTVLALQRGADPDKEMARAAAARFVGLTIPEGVPLGPPLAPGKYAAALAARISGDVSATSLEGVDYLKAQYYGVKEVFAEKQRRK